MITDGIQEYLRTDKFIHPRGKEAIKEFIMRETGFRPEYPGLRWQYVTKRGKFAKRMAAMIKKSEGIKLTSNQLGVIGDLARQHSNETEMIYYDITDNFNWNPGQFKDAGSCFWGANNEARGIMQKAGGLALRFYNELNPKKETHPTSDCGDPDCLCGDDVDGIMGTGRAWIVPHKRKWVLFNSYGLTNIKSARILAGIREADYKQVEVTNYGNTTGKIWINNSNGYMIGNNLPKTDMVDIEMGEDERKTCSLCNKKILSNPHSRDHRDFCKPCYYEAYVTTCKYCAHDAYTDGLGQNCGRCDRSYAEEAPPGPTTPERQAEAQTYRIGELRINPSPFAQWFYTNDNAE